MTHVVVCTHARHDLARGAVASVRRHASDVAAVTVLDSSGALEAWDGVDVLHVECPPYFHHTFAKRLPARTAVTVCIDDDVRLVRDVALSGRYQAGWYKPPNGHMVQAWAAGDGYTRLSQWRTSQRCDGLPAVLCDYAAATNAEQIDGVWLHIDKGSSMPTPERDALVRYIDNGPGLGDMMAAGLSSVGITKRLVSRLFGKPCGCLERQQAANRLGRRLGIG